MSIDDAALLMEKNLEKNPKVTWMMLRVRDSFEAEIDELRLLASPSPSRNLKIPEPVPRPVAENFPSQSSQARELFSNLGLQSSKPIREFELA